MFKVRPRALTGRIVDLVFALMRDGNLYLRFGQDLSTGVVLSEHQRRRLTGHVRILEVCTTPAELLHYLEEKRDARLQVDPDAFNESWNDFADDAQAAGRTLVRDRKAGEEKFQRLIEKDPGNGYLYLARGRAYEWLGETSLAAADYQSALNLLHEGDLFQADALRALARVTESRT
jgi:tetratricopeptide (TPR) repeat protein